MAKRRKRSRERTSRENGLRWVRIDLHVHTPASRSCYQQPEATFLEILQRAEARGIQILGITDHNTVKGYAAFRRELEILEFLERTDRLTPEEAHRLREYRRLLEKILVLPGFEFTATLGFHILGIFSPDTSIRRLEHLLLSMNVPEEALEEGSSEVGATVDVLQAYRMIHEAGGLVIAAHANSSNGVALLDRRYGGQTRIAYTQDPHLHALEVTDLESRSGQRLVRRFDGSIPEYPRRMYCIQGSDAHRLDGLPDQRQYGVGERATEVLLPEVSFAALKAFFEGPNFSRVRPYRPEARPYDPLRQALERGEGLVQAFHPTHYYSRRRKAWPILQDVVAFANTNGGTLYVGVDPEGPKVVGVKDPAEAQRYLAQQIREQIKPPLPVQIDLVESEGKPVLVLTVPKGEHPPYTLRETEIYVRQEDETVLATREEIIQLVTQGPEERPAFPEEGSPPPGPEGGEDGAEEGEDAVPAPPRTGVEVVATVEENGIRRHTLRNLRTGGLTEGVTRQSARKLWRYAIAQAEDHPLTPRSKVRWRGDLGLWRVRIRKGKARYDLVQRFPDGRVRIYYGVTEEGLHGPWRALVEAFAPETLEES